MLQKWVIQTNLMERFKSRKCDSSLIIIEIKFQINENEYLPADLLIVKSSDPKGAVFIETKNLDGETNLKHKAVP